MVDPAIILASRAFGNGFFSGFPRFFERIHYDQSGYYTTETAELLRDFAHQVAKVIYKATRTAKDRQADSKEAKQQGKPERVPENYKEPVTEEELKFLEYYSSDDEWDVKAADNIRRKLGLPEQFNNQ